MTNSCKIVARFECDSYIQKECKYFKQDSDCPTTKCISGLYERKCINGKAKKECLDQYYLNNKEKKDGS